MTIHQKINTIHVMEGYLYKVCVYACVVCVCVCVCVCVRARVCECVCALTNTPLI